MKVLMKESPQGLPKFSHLNRVYQQLMLTNDLFPGVKNKGKAARDSADFLVKMAKALRARADGDFKSKLDNKELQDLVDAIVIIDVDARETCPDCCAASREDI